MALREVLHTLLANNRTDVRREVVELFLQEVAGTGRGENTSKYNYIVESYGEYRIILKRPGLLNKGFDFAVDIDGIKFKNDNNAGYHVPSHKDIIQALHQIKTNYEDDYDAVKEVILQLYNMEEPNFQAIVDIKFKDYLNQEHPAIVILLTIKWLFIEQDITYWNWSGRNMLKTNL